MFRRAVILCFFGLLPNLGYGQPLRIAVASNFAIPLKNLINLYDQTYPAATTISVNARPTGKLPTSAFCQRGTPFDLFLAADTEQPKRLAKLA